MSNTIDIKSLSEFEEYIINNLTASYTESVNEYLAKIPKGIIKINNTEKIKIEQKYLRHTDLVFNKAIMRYIFSINKENGIDCYIAKDRNGRSLYVKNSKTYIHLISQERFIDYCTQKKWVEEQMLYRRSNTNNVYVVLVEDDKLSNDYMDILNKKAVNQNQFITFQYYISNNFGKDFWIELQNSFSKISETVNKYKNFELLNMGNNKNDQEDYEYYCKQINIDLKKYFEKLKDFPILLSGLASAEYLYDLYVNKMKEKVDFDYSCVSIMYYKTLEDFINKLIWIPYRKEVLEKKSNEVISTNLYLNEPKYYYDYNYKRVKESCELGPLGFLCSEIRKLPKFISFIQVYYGLKEDKDIQAIEDFGNRLKEKAKNRNNAAHGGVTVSYETVTEDKKNCLSCIIPGRSKRIN